MTRRAEAEVWAQETFGDAALGDARRTARLVLVAARAAERPAGKLSEVFTKGRELDAAYDFIEHDQTKPEALELAVGRATAKQCAREGGFVSVAVDGSSITLADEAETKDFGSIGCAGFGARGLKVMSAYAVGSRGVPLGILAQTYWARPKPKRRTEKQRRKRLSALPTEKKETQYWLETLGRAAARLEEKNARGWFQLDREGDAWPTLMALDQSGHRFTVRASWNRLVASVGHDKQYLNAKLAASQPIGEFDLEVPARTGCPARRARMVMHAMTVSLRLRDRRTHRVVRDLNINVVWVYEKGTTPGEKRLEWKLLTNAPIDTEAAARIVVLAYSSRWRIEEFHRTWKSGGCHVESMQLRRRNAVIRWATILAMVAVRIERLKRLARTEPERPASDELTPLEIKVLIALKRHYKKRTETIPNTMPTIATAVVWIAELGGYTGKSSGGPPGSVTIGRGLADLLLGVKVARALKEAHE